MTQEQFNQLNYLEPKFKTALESNFLRNIQSTDFNLVKSIYTEITNTKEELKMTCSTCIMNLFIRMARIYFEYKNNIPKQLISDDFDIDIIHQVITEDKMNDIEIFVDGSFGVTKEIYDELMKAKEAKLSTSEKAKDNTTKDNTTKDNTTKDNIKNDLSIEDKPKRKRGRPKKIK